MKKVHNEIKMSLLQEAVNDLSCVLAKHGASIEGFSNFSKTIYPVQLCIPGKDPIDLGYVCKGNSREIEGILTK